MWSQHSDPILSLLANNLINRNTFKVEISENPIAESRIEEVCRDISNRYKTSIEDTRRYLINASCVQKDMYDVTDDRISILYKDGSIKDISEASELLNVALLSKKIRKYYLCYQRL